MTEPTPPDPIDTDFSSPEPLTAQVLENRYLGLLTTYNVPWDNEKTARDVWQNFFDGQGGTLDGVTHSLNEIENGTQVAISGSGEYDYSHLMHMGGGTKSLEGSSVGGYREGAKVAALIMLTRMGAQQVVHESRDWRLTYYLGDVPDYMVGNQPSKGLYARVEKLPFQEGSRFTVKFPDSQTAQQFIEARNLFYSTENPDFQNPTYDNPEVGGFKLHKGAEGNIYEAGQRRHYIVGTLLTRKENDTGKYKSVPDITLWTRTKVFDADRDRGAVTEEQVKKRMIATIVNGMTVDDIRDVITNNPGFWYGRKKLAVPEETGLIDPEDIKETEVPTETEELQKFDFAAYLDSFMSVTYDLTVTGGLMTEIAKQYVSKYHGEALEFPSQYVAEGINGSYFAALEGAGYIICHPSMKDFGMATSDEVLVKLMEHFVVKPSEAESTRTGLLREFTRDLIGVEEAPPIWMFNAAKEKSFFHGHYTPEFLWVSQEQIHQEFSTALRTYLHEITHGNGKGHDTEFARVFGLLYNAAMLKMERAITDPISEDSQKVKQILEKWEETKGSLGELPQRTPN